MPIRNNAVTDIPMHGMGPYQEAVAGPKLVKLDPPPSTLAKIAKKVAPVALAIFGSLALLLLVATGLLALATTHGVALLLAPILGPGVIYTLTSVLPMVAAAAGSSTIVAGLSAAVNLAVQ